MKHVSATCPVCDTTVEDLAVDALFLTPSVFDDGSPLAGWVAWVCIECADLVAVAVDRRQFAALRLLGGHFVADQVPRWEPGALDARPAGAPFSLDDLIEFHQVLEEPTWLEHMMRSARVSGQPVDGATPEDGR